MDQPRSEQQSRGCVDCFLKNYQIPQISLNATIVLCVLFGVALIAIGIPMIVVMRGNVEKQVTYYRPGNADGCGFGDNCTIPLQIEVYMHAPVYLMYELSTFYQNHRRYIQSKSNYQLAGNTLSGVSQAELCSPYITNKDMGKKQSWGGAKLDPDAIASPCGAIAMTYFTDTFAIYNHNNEEIQINTRGLSWPNAKGKKYRRAANSSSTQWIDPENEHFIIWMQTAGLPNFKKPWGVIQTDLAPGQYSLTVSNNYNTTLWDGTRSLFLTTSSTFGGKNYVLPCTMLGVGGCCFLAGFLFFLKKNKLKQRIE